MINYNLGYCGLALLDKIELYSESVCPKNLFFKTLNEGLCESLSFYQIKIF